MGSLPTLELICFGPPTARVGGRPPVPEVLWTKHFALLIYLALSPGRRRSRDQLMGAFWGESSQDSARGSLNNALLLLRKHLGKKRLLNDGVSVVLNDTDLSVDAVRVDAMVKEEHLADAEMLMRGSFLDGFFVADAQEFEDWASAERRRFEDLRPRVLVAAGQRALHEGRYGAAVEYGRRALDLAPHAEPAVELRMRGLALGGDAATALSAYSEFAERLKREIGEPPSKALTALAERIRLGSLRPGVTPQTPRDALLVGRSDLHRDVLTTLTEGLDTGPRTIAITAEPGMGRSRLLAECLAHAVLKGAHVVRGRQLESDHDARWSLLRQVFRGGLTDAPGHTGARPDALAVLAGLVPELAPRFPPRGASDVAEVGAAVAAVLAAVADEVPLLLALDDVHWADGASLAALHAAMRSLPSARVALVVTFATGVGALPKELQQLEAEVGNGLPGITMELGPLDQADLLALVTGLAPWCHDESDRDRLARRLWVETEGNAFFAVTLLAALERATRLRADLMTWPLPERTTIDPFPISVPSVVRRAVQVRIAELDDPQRVVLRAAAIGSGSLDLPLIMQLAASALPEVEQALAVLERRHLVKYDGVRYTFVAPLVALVVRETDLTRGERHRMEAHAVDVLATRQELDARALRCELLARGEPDAAALSYIVATVRAAEDEGALRLARRAWVAGDKVATKGNLDRHELDPLRPSLAQL